MMGSVVCEGSDIARAIAIVVDSDRGTAKRSHG